MSISPHHKISHSHIVLSNSDQQNVNPITHSVLFVTVPSILRLQFKHKIQMQAFLGCLCPCLNNKQPSPRPKPQHPPPKKKKKTAKPIQTRIRSKFTLTDFVVVSDEQRNQKKVKAYCCPICTLYYTKILGCSQCVNLTCFSCLSSYETKMQKMKEKLKCPFCASQKSYYCDYELDPHSYFDATNKGFLSKEDREKLDELVMEKESEGERQQREVKVQSEQEVVR